MNSTLPLPFILLVAWIGLGTNAIHARPSHHEPDTLILKTEKHKGYGLFERSYWSLSLTEISEGDELMQVIPPGISNPTLGRDMIDYKPFWYANIKKSGSDYIHTFLKNYYPAKIDTAIAASERENFINVLIGMKDGDKVFIVDQNNNHDFRDDSIRLSQKMNFDAPMPAPIPCRYRIYNGKEMVEDSSWVLIELNRSDRECISVAHHVKATFSLNDHEYEIQSVNWAPHLRFSFDTSILGLTAQDGIQKDSLLTSEKLDLGEYLKLGESFYRFEDISNDGSTITLIREEDVSDKIGTQVGFIAPDFQGVTTEGDSVALTDYNNQYLLLANITGCWSPTMSYEYFKELSATYASNLNILAIDASLGALEANINNLGLTGSFILAPKNRSIQANYREDFCSRTCFLIGPSGHILDKFEIGDWETSLAKHFK